MNGERLGSAAKVLAEATSRRSLAGGVAGLLGGLALPTVPASAKRRCRGGRARCAGKCRDLQTNLDHCGSCNNACDPGEACVAGDCCTPGSGGCVAAAQRPFPQHVDYTVGILPNHRNQTQLDDDVRTAYNLWKQRYVVAAGNDNAGNPLYRIAFGKPGTDNHEFTVSEGQGYGMVIVAHLAGHDPEAQTIFDGLWRFVRAHPSEIPPHLLMDWRVPGGEGNDSAFDGDCEIAYGLLLADAQWGSSGAIDYAAALTTLLSGIQESTIGPQSDLPLLGDWVNPNGNDINQWTPRTSDFMLGHFRAFGRFISGADPWSDVADACSDVINALQTEYSPDTGLLPDFVEEENGPGHSPRPASAGFLEGPHDGHYNYNAGRDPWRIATDALINGIPASLAQVQKISQWAKAEANDDPDNIQAGYKLDGTPLANYFTTFFVAPLGVAAMVTAGQQQWLNDIYDAVYDRQEDYYEDSVTLLCLLVMTGNFWDPTV